MSDYLVHNYAMAMVNYLDARLGPHIAVAIQEWRNFSELEFKSIQMCSLFSGSSGKIITVTLILTE